MTIWNAVLPGNLGANSSIRTPKNTDFLDLPVLYFDYGETQNMAASADGSRRVSCRSIVFGNCRRRADPDAQTSLRRDPRTSPAQSASSNRRNHRFAAPTLPAADRLEKPAKVLPAISRILSPTRLG